MKTTHTLNQKSIRAQIDNIEIKGVIRSRTPVKIEVEMLAPFRNLSSELELPEKVRSHRSFDGPYAAQSARGLLGELYEIGLFIERNRTKLQKMYKGLKKQLQRLDKEMLTEQKFDEICSGMEALVESGEIDRRAYLKYLLELRSDLKRYKITKEALYTSFLRNNFPRTMSDLSKDSILPLLENA